MRSTGRVGICFRRGAPEPEKRRKAVGEAEEGLFGFPVLFFYCTPRCSARGDGPVGTHAEVGHTASQFPQFVHLVASMR